MKYRGIHYDEEMPSKVFFAFHAMLVMDSQKKNLDPYPSKLVGIPQR